MPTLWGNVAERPDVKAFGVEPLLEALAQLIMLRMISCRQHPEQVLLARGMRIINAGKSKLYDAALSHQENQ